MRFSVKNLLYQAKVSPQLKYFCNNYAERPQHTASARIPLVPLANHPGQYVVPHLAMSGQVLGAQIPLSVCSLGNLLILDDRRPA